MDNHVTVHKDRVVRLKDGSIAVCFAPEDGDPKYRYVRMGDSESGLVRVQSCSGYIHVPPENAKEWENEFELNEDDVDYELRFRMHQYVVGKSPKSNAMEIVGIPANSGSDDYTINIIGSSTSYTANDPGLVEITEEEANKKLAE